MKQLILFNLNRCRVQWYSMTTPTNGIDIQDPDIKRELGHLRTHISAMTEGQNHSMQSFCDEAKLDRQVMKELLGKVERLQENSTDILGKIQRKIK